MPDPVLQASGLRKVFRGFAAVDGVSFDMAPGEILGLLGPNGAGKTTIIHMLLGLTTPTAGRIRIFGLDLCGHRSRIIEEVNFSSTYVSMPNSLTVRECLEVYARLYRIRDRKARIDEVLRLFEIEDIATKIHRNLSSGQRTRLNLAKALINQPRILFLDEPTASLDPDIADKTRSLLLRIKEERGLSILYTSHNMKEMEEISDRLIFLDRGKVIAEGEPRELVARYDKENLEEVFLKVARENGP
jgi:ABC-2 type transport system ATP-binding protein